MGLWFKVPDLARAAVAALLCLSLFITDLMTYTEVNEAQLYPAALMAAYGVRSRGLLWSLTGLAISFAILGLLFDPPGELLSGTTNLVLAIIMTIAAAIAVRMVAGHEQRLVTEANTDPLTGVLNRRRFFELAKREQTRSRRHNVFFSVLMLDIDHFKRINDTHGHAIGDQAIKRMADICRSVLRSHDILARYGGEEFVLVLPETSHEGAHVVAERIRKKVETGALETDQGPVRFTVSVGVSTIQEGGDVERVISRADEALYQAKQSGRNRVVGRVLENTSAADSVAAKSSSDSATLEPERVPNSPIPKS